jgi:hypothetical protein
MHIRTRRIPFAALMVASAALSCACSSLGPCALYRCPRLDVRNGENCREVFAVNRDNVAKTFSLRLYYREGPGAVIGTSYLLGPGEGLFLGCAPECDLGSCWYDMFDARDAGPPRDSR